MGREYDFTKDYGAPVKCTWYGGPSDKYLRMTEVYALGARGNLTTSRQVVVRAECERAVIAIEPPLPA